MNLFEFVAYIRYLSSIRIITHLLNTTKAKIVSQYDLTVEHIYTSIPPMEREQQDDNYFCHQPSVQGNEKSNEKWALPIPQLHLEFSENYMGLVDRGIYGSGQEEKFTLRITCGEQSPTKSL